MAFKKRPMAKRGRKLRKTTKTKRNTGKTLTKIIKRVIKDTVEDKQAFHSTGDTLTYFNSGITSTGDMIRILPNVTQGTADNNRIGDQIRAQSLNIKGYVKLDPNTLWNDNALPTVFCRLFVVSLKTKPNYTEASSSATPLSGLLRKGGTTVGYTGILSDMFAPVNTELWTVHEDRKFYLSQDALHQPATLGPISVSMNLKNTVKFFNISVKCKNKLLKYDSNVSSNLLPTNFGPMILLGYTFLNGASPDTVSTRVGMEFISTLTYEDA